MWRCSRSIGCGEVEYYYIGGGDPYAASSEYNPNKDSNCTCVRKCAKGQPNYKGTGVVDGKPVEPNVNR
jgi:hypothetical protein